MKSNKQILNKEELIKVLEEAHDIVWQGGKLNPSEAFDEISKILFCKVYDEKNIKDNFTIKENEDIEDVVNRIHKVYTEYSNNDKNVFSENIKLDDEILYKIVSKLQDINFTDTEIDVKGVAFERFMGDFFKGKMGQYFTPREIVEFMVEMLDIKEDKLVLDPACGSGGFLLNIMTSVSKRIPGDINSFASNNLFGIEINEQISRICKMNMIIHNDGHTNIISTDALDDIDNHTKLNNKFVKNRFDIILTNPPFGAKVLKNEKKYLTDYELGKTPDRVVRSSQSTEILFIERCLQYLKYGGHLGIVLPDGILTNTSLQYVRDYLLQHTRIDAVVSIPQTAFSYYGAGVKCSILFLTKTNKDISDDYEVFMAVADKVGYDATGRQTENDLDTILEKYKIFKRENESSRCIE